MKIKVCGMKHPGNIQDLGGLPVHLMGMIFYGPSPRYVGLLKPEDLDVLPSSIERVGVFVNAGLDYIKQTADTYQLDKLQLHGQETVAFCRELNRTIPVIKAFNVSDISDLEQTKSYEDVCSYFLFDSKTLQHGGSGTQFDWSILDAYQGHVPFFLSGGIALEDAEIVKKIQHPKLYGIDINSRFETAPGLKNITLIKQFLKRLNDEQD